MREWIVDVCNHSNTWHNRPNNTERNKQLLLMQSILFSTHMFNFYYFVLLWEPQNCHQSVMQFHAISNSKCNFFVELNSWFIFVQLMVSKILLARNGNQLDTRFEICVCILSSIHNFISLLSELHVVGGEKSINFIINSSFTQKKMKRKE